MGPQIPVYTMLEKVNYLRSKAGLIVNFITSYR